MLLNTAGWNHSQDSPLVLSTKRDETMQPQMPWTESPQGWMQKLWSPSWMGSLCNWQEEQKLTTQWWQKLTMRYIRRSRKLLSKLEPLIHVWTCTWLIGSLLNGKIQYLKPWLIGSPIGKYRIRSISLEMTWTLRRKWLSFESKKSWCSVKEPSITATHWLASWKKFCSL